MEHECLVAQSNWRIVSLSVVNSSMEQTQLNIIPQITYSAKGYVAHTGVQTTLRSVSSGIQSDEFQLFHIFGSKRSGKSHLSVYLSSLAHSLKKYPILVEGKDFLSWNLSLKIKDSFFEQEDLVLIIDDADIYFRDLAKVNAGHFVDCVESLRVNKATMIFLSSDQSSQYSVDQHVLSRLTPGDGYQITNPDSEDMTALIEAVLLQRGMKLSKKSLEYLHKRLPRDIKEICNFVDRLEHLSQVLKKPITFPLVIDALGFVY